MANKPGSDKDTIFLVCLEMDSVVDTSNVGVAPDASAETGAILGVFDPKNPTDVGAAAGVPVALVLPVLGVLPFPRRRPIRDWSTIT